MVMRVANIASRYEDGLTHVINGTNRPNFHESKALFAAMWMEGFTIPQIMDTIGIKSLITVWRWHRRLGLPPRLRGNYPRAAQVAYMGSNSGGAQ